MNNYVKMSKILESLQYDRTKPSIAKAKKFLFSKKLSYSEYRNFASALEDIGIKFEEKELKQWNTFISLS